MKTEGMYTSLDHDPETVLSRWTKRPGVFAVLTDTDVVIVGGGADVAKAARVVMGKARTFGVKIVDIYPIQTEEIRYNRRDVIEELFEVGATRIGSGSSFRVKWSRVGAAVANGVDRHW